MVSSATPTTRGCPGTTQPFASTSVAVPEKLWSTPWGALVTTPDRNLLENIPFHVDRLNEIDRPH